MCKGEGSTHLSLAHSDGLGVKLDPCTEPVVERVSELHHLVVHLPVRVVKVVRIVVEEHALGVCGGDIAVKGRE